MTEHEHQAPELTLEDSISVLRNMKRRTQEYGEIYGYMGEEYCRRLAEVERLAIDNVILALEMGAEMVDPPPKQMPAMPISMPVVTSLDEASAVMTPKEIYARCRAEKPEWRISEGAIRNWAKTGQLPCMRSGNRILIGWSTFCTFVANGTAQVSPEVAAAEAAAIDRASKGIPTPQEIRAAIRESRAAEREAQREARQERAKAREEGKAKQAMKSQETPEQASGAEVAYTPSPEIMDALKRIRERAVPSK